MLDIEPGMIPCSISQWSQKQSYVEDIKWFYFGFKLEIYISKTGSLYCIVSCLIWGSVNMSFVLLGVIVINNNTLETTRLSFIKLFVWASEGKSRYWSNSTVYELIYWEYAAILSWKIQVNLRMKDQSCSVAVYPQNIWNLCPEI